MTYKVFIDGAEGTTGLKIHEYFKDREEIEVIKIDPEKRKDLDERVKMITQADISFLCLPDAASREVAAAAPKECKIIDTSTAHRTNPEWTYGMPELDSEQRDKIRNSSRVANPGCHATGFIFLIKPLIANDYLPADYPFSGTSLTGYSGGGKKMIAQYEDGVRSEMTGRYSGDPLESPRQYGIAQSHKHIPEILACTGIKNAPAFMPIVADYYSGMEVTIPVSGAAIAKHMNVPQEGIKDKVLEMMQNYYEGNAIVTVVEAMDDGGFVAANRLSGSNELEITVEGNDENILLIATFDNLGKGASGAAVQNMNIMLGLDETTGLL